jgi:hypothetical protein
MRIVPVDEAQPTVGSTARKVFFGKYTKPFCTIARQPADEHYCD